MSGEPPGKVQLTFAGLTPEQSKACLQQAIEQAGLSMTFKTGSNPVLHVHIHVEQRAENMGQKTTSSIGSISAGGDATLGDKVAGDQLTAGSVGGDFAGRDIKKAGGDILDESGGQPVRSVHFNQDVTSLLSMVARADLSLSEKGRTQAALGQMMALDVDGKALEDVRSMVEDLWIRQASDDNKTLLQRVLSLSGIRDALNSMTVLGKVLLMIVGK